MADVGKAKIKLLKMYELLQQQTDENHPMIGAKVCEALERQGIPCDRRTLTRDIKTLNAFGFEVMATFIGHEKAYYVLDRSFSIPELKILIDAVQAASFIPAKKSEELISRIAAIAGSNQGQVLTESKAVFNTRKHSNELIYYNVDALEQAIEKNRKITFKYFDLDENCRRVYRKDGRHYVVEPIALVFNEDNYYLVAYSAKYDGTANYRIDRMTDVEVLDGKITAKAKKQLEKVSATTEQAFKMYGGKPITVELQFENALIGPVYDKFGEYTKMKRLDEEHCSAKVMVQISPTFWGWLFQFGTKMQILSPACVAEEYKERIIEIFNRKEDTVCQC